MTMRQWKTVTRTEVEHKSLTLSETLQFQRSELTCGIIESMVTVNRFFELLPFQTVTKVSFDPYVAGANNEISEIASAAKRLGRGYMEDVARKLTTRLRAPFLPVEEKLNFTMLDWLFNQVENPDFFMMHHGLMRDMYGLFRAGGEGARAWQTTMELPSGRTVPEYKGVPVFRNDYMHEQKIVLGRFDDETRKYGVSGLVPEVGFIDVDRSGNGWLLAFFGDFTVFNEEAVTGLTNVHHW